MWKILEKLLPSKKKKVAPKQPSVHVVDYGRYQYKPLIERALTEVTKIGRIELVQLAHDGQIALNGEVISEGDLARRLSSGSYEIILPTQLRVWRFFIA